jgi:hypothetical protein
VVVSGEEADRLKAARRWPLKGVFVCGRKYLAAER